MNKDQKLMLRKFNSSYRKARDGILQEVNELHVRNGHRNPGDKRYISDALDIIRKKLSLPNY